MKEKKKELACYHFFWQNYSFSGKCHEKKLCEQKAVCNY